MTSAILLDTHAALWLTGEALGDAALTKLAEAALGDGILVSPITAWEVGLLSRRPKAAKAMGAGLARDPARWFGRLLALPAVRECSLDSQIALASTTLPGTLHNDPADRMLIATARAYGCSLMTRDGNIRAYAAQGHLRVIPC